MNRNIICILLISTVTGCSNIETEIANPVQQEVEIPSPGFVSLSEYGLPISMDIGPKNQSDFHFYWNETFGRLEINNGQDIDFFVSQDTIRCATRKGEIESGIFTIDYIVENEEVLFYEATLPFSSSSYYHFFVCLRVDGKIYNLENNPLVEFRKSDIASMIDLSKSFKAVHIEEI